MHGTRTCAIALVSVLLASGALAQERTESAPLPDAAPDMPVQASALDALGPQDPTPGLRAGAQLLAGIGGYVGGGLLTAGAIGGVLQSGCSPGGECALHALPWFGTGAGLGSALAVSLVGNLFTHEPALLWTLGGGLAGGLLSTGIWYLNPLAGMVSTVVLPLLGSMVGYHVGLGTAVEAARAPQRPRVTVVPFTRDDKLGLALAGVF